MRKKALASARSVPLSEIKAELFKALAHPARIRVLELLVDGEQSVAALLPLVDIEPANLSQQLAVLRRAGLVASRKEGSSVFYTIRDPDLVELLAVARRMLLTSMTERQELIRDLRDSVASA